MLGLNLKRLQTAVTAVNRMPLLDMRLSRWPGVLLVELGWWGCQGRPGDGMNCRKSSPCEQAGKADEGADGEVNQPP